jgi:DNA repair photolyase
LKDLFSEWLEENYPLKKQHVINQIRAVREGALYNNQFGKRMQGNGPIAEMIHQRFQLAVKKFGLNKTEVELSTEQFFKPTRNSATQLSLF